MRKAALAVLVLGSLVLGCEDEKKPAPPAPSASAATTAASATPTASASAAPKLSMAEMMTASQKLIAESVNKHDAKLFASAYAPDGILKIAGIPDIKGRDAIEKQTKADFVGIPDAKFAFARVWVKGNVAVSEWVYAGTNTGDWNGQKASGKPVGVNGVSVVVLNDEGLVKEERRYFDMPTTQSQMDPKAKPGSFRPVPTVPGSTEQHVAKDDDALLKQVNAMYATFEGHKQADFMAFVTDDTTYDDYSSPAIMKGKKPIGEMFTMYNAGIPDFKQTHDLQIVSDGWVITEGVLTGTHKGQVGPFKATNKPVTLHFIDFFQVKDSKIVAGRTYQNLLEFLVAIGVAPAPGAAPAASASAAPSASGPTPATKASK